MNYVHREHIDHPSAWTSRSIGGKQGLVYRLDPRHLDAFDVILAGTSNIEPLDVTRAQFAHPAIEPLMAEVRDILLKGRGSVIISGLTRERYSDEQFERIYWGFGLHLGVPISQSYRGDRLGRHAAGVEGDFVRQPAARKTRQGGNCWTKPGWTMFGKQERYVVKHRGLGL